MGLETAAIIGIASAASSLIGSGANFLSAGKQRRKAEQAADKASGAFENAQKELAPNYLKGRSIVKEPYELSREAGLSGLGQIVQAGQEGEQRGAIATAGRANVFNQQQQARSRVAMGQELQRLQDEAAREESRLAGARSKLFQGEAQGYQGMASDARAAEAALKQSAAQGLISAGAAGLQSAPLYSGGGATTPEASNLMSVSGLGQNQELSGLQSLTAVPQYDFGIDDKIFEPIFLTSKTP